MIPAIATFDVVKGFRRRYLDLSGAELGDLARDDLLVLDSNLYPLPNGFGSLFRIARVSNNPNYPIAALSIYRAMPLNYRLRAGSYFGCTIFADPKDLIAARWTEPVEEIAEALGQAIRDWGPEHWELRKFRPDLSELGPEPNLSTLPPAFDNRWPRSDKNVFIDSRGENLDHFHDKLGSFMHFGTALITYSNILFTFDEDITNSIIDRGQAVTRTLEHIFSRSNEEPASSSNGARDRNSYRDLVQPRYVPAPRKSDKPNLAEDLLLSRPIRQKRMPPPKPVTRSIQTGQTFSLPKYGIPISVAGFIILIAIVIGFNQDWLSPGRTADRPDLDSGPQEHKTPQSEFGQPNFGTRELRIDQDQYPFGPAATRPEVVQGDDDMAPFEADEAEKSSVEILESVRQNLTDALADPVVIEDRAARRLIKDFIKRIDRHLKRNDKS